VDRHRFDADPDLKFHFERSHQGRYMLIIRESPLESLKFSVVDRYRLEADPDPTFHFVAAPDPALFRQ
jgi:hypothetical protein